MIRLDMLLQRKFNSTTKKWIRQETQQMPGKGSSAKRILRSFHISTRCLIQGEIRRDMLWCLELRMAERRLLCGETKQVAIGSLWVTS